MQEYKVGDRIEHLFGQGLSAYRKHPKKKGGALKRIWGASWFFKELIVKELDH
jgi:hypothetical protein